MELSIYETSALCDTEQKQKQHRAFLRKLEILDSVFEPRWYKLVSLPYLVNQSKFWNVLFEFIISLFPKSPDYLGYSVTHDQL